MPSNLLIISDTRVQLLNGKFYGFNSVVKELEVFQSLFKRIIWIGYDYSNLPLDETLLEVNPNITVLLLPRSGGSSLSSKLYILLLIPRYLYTIIKQLKQADVVHSRGPSVPMLLALIISFFYKKPRWWFKYANNWSDTTPPIAWLVQKKLMLINTRSIGTINGKWPDTPDHIKAYENPCLDYVPGLRKKKYIPPFDLLFVGRITNKKGINTAINAINKIPKSLVNSLTIVGDGPDLKRLISLVDESKQLQNIIFTGNLSKDEVINRLRSSDFLLLPTLASEGFPKVVAEAFFAGCIPVVSDISSLDQYVKDEINGFVWKINGSESFSDTLLRALSKDENTYTKILREGNRECSLFTYEYYYQRIKIDVLFYNQ